MWRGGGFHRGLLLTMPSFRLVGCLHRFVLPSQWARAFGAGAVSATVACGVAVPTVAFCLSAGNINSSSPASFLPTSGAEVGGTPVRPAVRCGEWIEGLPVFTAREVQQHNSRRSRVWVTFREGVYDVTDFLDLHPGGPEKIMLAAGRDVESYWKSLPQHFEGVVGNILENYRVGNTIPSGGMRSRLAPSSVSGGPMAWMSTLVWGEGTASADTSKLPPPELRTEHDLQWESWKRAMKEGGGNLCEKEGVENRVDAQLASLRDEHRRKQEELNLKRAQFNEAERVRLSKLNNMPKE